MKKVKFIVLFCFQNPCKEGDSGRAAKRVRKNESVDVEKIWEEMNDGSTQSSESDPEVESPPSPEDWHSQFPNVSFTI